MLCRALRLRVKTRSARQPTSHLPSPDVSTSQPCLEFYPLGLGLHGHALSRVLGGLPSRQSGRALRYALHAVRLACVQVASP